VYLGGSGTVDGTLISAGTVVGTGYYPSVQNATPLKFPDAATLNTMMASYKTMATAAGSTTYLASDLFRNGKKTETITAPAYIVGEISMTNGQTLVLQGDDMVYVDGNLRMNGGAVLNSSTFVVNGSFIQNGTATYAIGATASGAATPSFATLNGNMQLNGGATNQLWGIIYAMNGAINVNGDATFTGAMVSEGTGAAITSTGAFNQYFPTNMASRIKIPSDAKVTQILEF
jgi:hypothetical protein